MDLIRARVANASAATTEAGRGVLLPGLTASMAAIVGTVLIFSPAATADHRGVPHGSKPGRTTTTTTTTAPPTTTTTTTAPTATTTSPATTTSATKPAPTPGVLFTENFDGASLNTSVWYRCYKWTVETDGCSNNPGLELQWYQPGNVSVANGSLALTAKAESVKAGYPYTSGMVTTGGAWGQTPPFSFTYGYVEVRAKVPAGAGMWPAIWMLPNDASWPPEIDVMEYQGVKPTTDYVTLHWLDSAGKKQSSGMPHNAGVDLSRDFHTYAVDWQPGYLAFYLDGVEVHRITDSSAIPAKPMYVLLNLAIGGWDAGQLTPDSTKFPATFYVDYVRVSGTKS